MSEPTILYFDYRERGQEKTREIELEIISPEFYDNGKKALKIYSNLLDINDRWQNKARYEFYKIMKESGYNPTKQFFNDIDVKIEEGKEYTEEQLNTLNKKIAIKDEVEYLMTMTPSYNSQMYFEMYQYLIENLFMFVFKDLKIDWTNPSVPFLDIAKAYYSVWQNVFIGSVRDTKKILNEEKKEENVSSDALTNTPSENQNQSENNLDSLPTQTIPNESQNRRTEITISTPESLTL